MFSQGGYSETTMEEITERLGITRPLFYYYFRSKDDLLWRLIGQVGQELIDRSRPIAESDLPPVEKLRELLRCHAEAVVENHDGYRVYFAERHLVSGRRAEALRRGEDEFEAMHASVVRAGQETGDFREGDPLLLARLAVGVINAIVRWYDPAEYDPQVVAETCTTVALEGLRVSHSPRMAASRKITSATTAEEGPTMAVGLLVAYTSPAADVSDAEYNAWYESVHIPEIRQHVPGVGTVRRWRIMTGEPDPRGARFVATYEISVDLRIAQAAFVEASRDGRISRSTVIDVVTWPPELAWLEGLPAAAS